MNKTVFAMTMLELHLDAWEPISSDGQFAIKHRKTGQFIGTGKSLKAAILKARDYEIGKLNKKG